MKNKKRLWLWIDPTRRCNLSCSLCYTKPSHAKVDLMPDVLHQILDKLQVEEIDIQELTLNWRGEPLMNKAFPELLSIIRERELSCPVQFHTNAILFRKDVAEAVLKQAGPLRIFISIDGGSIESHERNRGKGTFYAAINGAWRLLEARGRATNPQIILYQLDLCEKPSNYDPEFLKLAYAVDSWQRVLPVLPNGDDSVFKYEEEQLGGTHLINKWANVVLSSPVPQGPCFWAGNSLSIAPNGEVSICILSNSNAGVLGNILKESAISLLERSRMWRYTLKVYGRRSVAHCQNCRKCEGDAYSQKDRLSNSQILSEK